MKVARTREYCTPYVRADIVEVRGNYTAFFAVYANGQRVFCYSDHLEACRTPRRAHEGS